MRWFKHMTGAHRDESLCRMMDEFGLEGYGAYWIVLETIAAQCDKKDADGKISLTLSVKNWRKIVPFAPQKLTKWLAFAEQLALFCVEMSENLITVSCPKLLKYCDEYANRRKKNRDIVGTLSGQTPKIMLALATTLRMGLISLRLCPLLHSPHVQTTW